MAGSSDIAVEVDTARLDTSRFKKCCVNCVLLYYSSTEFKSAFNVFWDFWHGKGAAGLSCTELTIWEFPLLRGACRQGRNSTVRGASKIKLKKVNKKRTVRVRRVIIFLDISRHPLLIWLHCCFHQYKTLKAVATAKAAIVLLTPAKNLNKVFWGFLVVFPLFNNFLGYV